MVHSAPHSLGREFWPMTRKTNRRMPCMTWQKFCYSILYVGVFEWVITQTIIAVVISYSRNRFYNQEKWYMMFFWISWIHNRTYRLYLYVKISTRVFPAEMKSRFLCVTFSCYPKALYRNRFCDSTFKLYATRVSAPSIRPSKYWNRIHVSWRFAVFPFQSDTCRPVHRDVYLTTISTICCTNFWEQALAPKVIHDLGTRAK